ncbi:glycosyltransferase family 4 protein [Desulfopila sp. IMCC35008]|uniref:glycosyltransferase family 4 protein n=1 Tax=Desulfopila sp. IMCC35008 TaxID=2653858 RepID=UPI0013D115F5|nr:glycosyltransferase family 4 protein [Desulfopila sp. IMCC35008]
MSPRTTIGYILKGYPRISETFISNEILLLEELGFSIRLFSMRHPRETFCHDSVKQIRAAVDYLPTELLLEFHRLLLPNLFLAAKNPPRYRKAMALAGERFRRNRKLATLKHLLQAGYMTNRFLLNEPDIGHLHGHFAHSPTSVTMFASMLSGLPFSFTAHAKDIYTSNPAQLKEKIEKAGFVVTCTRHNSEFLEQLAGSHSTPIHCVYHGIDLQLFNQQVRSTRSQPPYKLLTIARMTEKKGLPDLYRALSLLKKRGLEFKHTLIGDGDDREKILALIEELDLQNECICLGTRTHTEVLDQFRQTDLFVLACRIAKSGDRDGIPNVLVESLAMGVPALSTNVSAIPEILKHGETGYTIEPDNPELMAESIEKILLDNDLRNRISEQGRDWVHNQFDNRRWVRNLADIFQAQPHLQLA